jgi:hypothetical protein
MNIRIFIYKPFYILIILLSGCGVTHEEVEKDIENVLKIDIPSDFEIIEENVSTPIGDYSVTYIIKYKIESFNKLLKKINLSSWKDLGNNYFSYEVHNEDQSTEDIFLRLNEHEVKYFYYQD